MSVFVAYNFVYIQTIDVFYLEPSQVFQAVIKIFVFYRVNTEQVMLGLAHDALYLINILSMLSISIVIWFNEEKEKNQNDAHKKVYLRSTGLNFLWIVFT